jgi:hypothetical protein
MTRSTPFPPFVCQAVCVCVLPCFAYFDFVILNQPRLFLRAIVALWILVGFALLRHMTYSDAITLPSQIWAIPEGWIYFLNWRRYFNVVSLDQGREHASEAAIAALTSPSFRIAGDWLEDIGSVGHPSVHGDGDELRLSNVKHYRSDNLHAQTVLNYCATY